MKHTIGIGKLWVCYNERYDGHGVAARKRPLNHVFWDMVSDVTTWYNERADGHGVASGGVHWIQHNKPERVMNR